MRITFVVALLVLCFFGSCVEEAPLANATISEESMVSILAEMHLAEGLFLTESQPARDSMAQIYIPLILNKHGASQEEFNRNFDLYVSIPEVAGPLFERVKKRLENLTADTPAK